MGQLIGGIFAVYLLSAIFEFALFKRVMNDPMHGKMASVVSGYLFTIVVAGFGYADGGPPVFGKAAMLYLPGFLVAGALFYRRALAIRHQAIPDADAETFS